ncbi:PDZ domain-containing protein [Methylophilus sp. Leaf408]|uniref:PDZ domain-containing protein n=1 Tax=Methylophilus sp. Leaf408 TaxID=2876561 RepID=UPI001E56D51E|nr:PDZ domain-containing protein [Methylophilus sp. Leaf408]
MKVLCKAARVTGRAASPRQWFILLPSLAIITLLMFSKTVLADENPYAANYQAQNQGNLHSLQNNPEPQLLIGTRRDGDNIKMLENGYDLMGLSEFEAGDIAPELAIIHGRNIQADTILVYVKKSGNATPASKMEVIKEAVKKGQSLTEKDMAIDPGKYRYYATYWAKLPPPVLGVHVIKLVARKSSQQDEQAQATDVNEGVRVIAVIHGSAAEQGGLLRGDQLLSLNQEKVNDAATLSSLVRRFKGNTVTIKIQRQSEALSLKVAL